MNRTLRRPMFRIGGTAEGITSGLSRQEYHGTDNAADQRVQQAPKTGMRDFLINFGLDLASRSPSGSIFSTAAESAKDPFKQYQAGKVAREKMAWERGLHEEEMGFKREQFEAQQSQFDQELEQDRYLGELAAKGQNEFKKEMIDKVWDAKIAEEKDTTKHADMEKQRLSDINRYIIKGEDISDQFKILSNQSATYMAQGLAEDAILIAINPKTKVAWKKDDDGYALALLKLYKKYLKITSEFLLEEERESDATGGRVGYQNAGAVMPEQPIQAQAPGPTDQGETNQVNISYEQLRERLPQEISNEIVLLLSQSYEAFADFAEIQTQADVNEFNTKYNVQLFLPKQAGA